MENMTNTLQLKLDTPVWYKADLDATGKVRFFQDPGLSNKSSIDQSLAIDRLAQYDAALIQIAVMRTDGTPWNAPAVALLAKFIRYTYFTFDKNGRENVWACPAATFLATPVTMTDAITGWDISKSCMGSYILNEQIIIPGGQALSIYNNWAVADVATLAGLTVQFGLFGILDREKMGKG